MNVVYPPQNVKSVKFCWTGNECTFGTYSFKNFLHEHSTFPLAFYYKKATRIAHILPERVGNSDFSQDQLLVDMVKNLILTKTIFSRNLIHFEIRFWQSLRYYNWALLSLFKCKLVIDCMSTVIQPSVSLFTDLKQLIIYSIIAGEWKLLSVTENS